MESIENVRRVVVRSLEYYDNCCYSGMEFSHDDVFFILADGSVFPEYTEEKYDKYMKLVKEEEKKYKERIDKNRNDKHPHSDEYMAVNFPHEIFVYGKSFVTIEAATKEAALMKALQDAVDIKERAHTALWEYVENTYKHGPSWPIYPESEVK